LIKRAGEYPVLGKARINDFDRSIGIALVRLEFERLGVGAVLNGQRCGCRASGRKYIPASESHSAFLLMSCGRSAATDG
jgi:hypothetical protein